MISIIFSMFVEGVMSFFSPCVLPLVPLYMGYLSAGAKSVDEEGNVTYKRGKVFVATLCFVLGISFAIILMSMAATSFKQWFDDYSLAIRIISGCLLVVFGLMMLGVLVVPFLQQEHRFKLPFSLGSMNGLKAFALGFLFSFGWTPCIGPMLASALVMTSQASDTATGYLYIGAYILGFVFMFLLLGLFTEEILNLLKKHKGVVKWTTIIGGLLVLAMGIYMIGNGAAEVKALSQAAAASAETETTGDSMIEKYSFTTVDAQGNTIELKQFKGKPVVLTFFRTWCTYCSQELAVLDKLQDEYPDVYFLLVTSPADSTEKDIAGVEQWMKEHDHKVKVLYDEIGTADMIYGISGFPTTFFFYADGETAGYAPGYMDEDQFRTVMEALVI